MAVLIRDARLVPIGGAPAPGSAVDVRIRGDRVVEVAPGLRPGRDEVVIEGAGRHLMPGLWDAHVHPVMWGLSRARIDLAGAAGPGEVCDRVAAHLTGHPGDGLVLGYGYRSAAWSAQPTVAELDAATGNRPVALTSGDAHNGWLNTAALRLIGEPDRVGALVEGEWYAAYEKLNPIAAQHEDSEGALRAALEAAAARGVVGIVDFEFGSAWRAWIDRLPDGVPPVRVRAATYPDALAEVAERGLRTGDPLVPGVDRVTMGSLKVISDGSLNTMTAWCCQPYAGVEGRDVRGKPNIPLADLTAIMVRAKDIGLTAAIHAIGDRAVGEALTAFATSGQTGSIEHAQLVSQGDFARLAALGLVASVQPVHLLDDRDVTDRFWGDRSGRCYAFRSMLEAGIRVALGSDAPVAPLDPWLALAAAVHRSADERSPWHPEQAMTAAEALAASTDGRPTVGPGSLADLVLLDADPLAAASDSAALDAHLRAMPVAATMVGGRFTYGPPA